ncbi:hypothetical protein IAT38_003840 [Cryptococcus sp. DSM 104549]
MAPATRAARTAISAATTAAAAVKRPRVSRSAIAPSPAQAKVKSETAPQAKKRRTKAVEPRVDETPATAAIIPPPVPGQPIPHSSTALLPPVLTFDLPTAVSHLSTLDPRFALFFEHHPCRPFTHLEPLDPFRTLITSIIGQQVSWLAARAINGRFRALFGFSDENEGFPTPEMVEKQDAASLRAVGLSGRKVEYVVSLAQHFTSGQLSTHLLQTGTDEEISKALIAVRGIGQWTVDMFMIFSLRRPDILAVGDLGVQKGLLKWALAAHGALERKVGATPKKGKGKKKVEVKDEVDEDGDGEVDTLVRDQTPERAAPSSSIPPTPLTPAPNGDSSTGVHTAALHTPATPLASKTAQVPPTPATPTGPAEAVEVPPETLPTPTPQAILAPLTGHPDWNPYKAMPLEFGLSVEVLKARLNGKKVKGGMYLTPHEMESLTEGWRPYRSLGVFYMWPVAGEE